MNRQEVYSIIEKHYRKHFDRLVNSQTRRLRNRADAEEAVQEAYTNACQYWDSCIDPEKNFDAWFSTILRNAATDKRQDILRKGMCTPLDEEHVKAYLRKGTEYFITSNADATIELKEIQDKIMKQPERERVILFLRHFKDYDPQDISKVVPETVRVIKNILYRFKVDLMIDAKISR